MTAPATAKEVAAWKLKELNEQDLLYQEVAAYEILDRFGEHFTYYNENGNLAIDKTVLAAFRHITGDDVVWCRSERYWRRREEGDLPGRQQP